MPGGDVEKRVRSTDPQERVEVGAAWLNVPGVPLAIEKSNITRLGSRLC